MSGPPVECLLGGERLRLLAQRAAFICERDTLLVADAHIGKAVSFRRLGVPVPSGTTAEALAALTDLVAGTRAAHIVFLGDFLHSASARAPATLDALARWREAHSALQLTLVRGNHDARAGDPPAELGIDVVDEPLRLGRLALCHYPQELPGVYVLAGHWHPCVHVGGRANDRLRLPCFWFGREDIEEARPVGVLPAFGGFTGMHPIDRRPADRVWAVAEGQVVALP